MATITKKRPAAGRAQPKSKARPPATLKLAGNAKQEQAVRELTPNEETMRDALHSANRMLDERAELLLDSADSILCTVQSTEQTLSGPLAFAASSIIEDAIRSVKSAKGSIDDARRVLFEIRYGNTAAECGAV